MEFKIVRKGYDTKETDEYILKLTKDHQDELDKQRALILMLKDKLVAQDKKIKEYESKKDLISSALMRAVEKAEELDKTVQDKIAGEVASLKSFHLRWTAYYKKLIEKYPVSEELEKAKEFTDKVNELFKSEDMGDREALEYFRREQEKISGIPATMPKAKPGQFDYEEALNPTDDLAKILADLDIMSEE